MDTPSKPSNSAARTPGPNVAPELGGNTLIGGDVTLAGVALGIDVGGTGVKAAIVDLATAELVSPRIREQTPEPSTPEAVIKVISSVVDRVLAEYGEVQDLVIGCGLPGTIQGGYMKTAANVDKSWIDLDAATRISDALGRPVRVINDADAAGLAELAYGEASGKPGTIILLTVGTGIGSALISEGRLVPNTECGHLVMRGKSAETLVGGAARNRRGIGWKRWARDFNAYLALIELFLWPDLIILGGGVSKDSAKFWGYLQSRAPIVKARYLNTSGIIGAAYAAGLAAHRDAGSASSTDEPVISDASSRSDQNGRSDGQAKPDKTAKSDKAAKSGKAAKRD